MDTDAQPAAAPLLQWSSQAVMDVAAERKRQISKGYTAEHDCGHSHSELVNAATCYCLSAGYAKHYQEPPTLWPWEATAWKPRSKREDLVRAAALLIAAIERCDRGSPQIASCPSGKCEVPARDCFGSGCLAG